MLTEIYKKHVEKCGDKAVKYHTFWHRINSLGRDEELAINTPSRGQGGSIYYAKHKGTKMQYKIINRW